jgi:hypothetical protein
MNLTGAALHKVSGGLKLQSIDGESQDLKHNGEIEDPGLRLGIVHAGQPSAMRAPLYAAKIAAIAVYASCVSVRG